MSISRVRGECSPDPLKLRCGQFRESLRSNCESGKLLVLPVRWQCTLEWIPSGNHQQECHRECIDVTKSIGGLGIAKLFRWHECYGSEPVTRECEVGLLRKVFHEA